MPENDPALLKGEGQGFDSVAGLYDAFRPGYPEPLIHSVISLSHLRPGEKILEIGSGTGRATLPFARAGFPILCIEPGRNLIAVAKRHLSCFPNVKFVPTRFEDWSHGRQEFDLVISAQAFHWIPKEIGYPKAADALRPGGHLALFWNMNPGVHGQIRVELDKIYQRIAPGLHTSLDAGKDAIQNRIQEIRESGCFSRVRVLRFPWSVRYSTTEYIGLLNTYSDHIKLPQDTRKVLLENIRELIDRLGGTFERPYLAVLFHAEKA